MKTLNADYCIIGAGYSGLAAAYRLLQAGSSVIVFEARDRVGGRVWSHELTDGTSFDIGGQWVSEWPAQPHVRNLIQQISGDTRTPIRMYTQYTRGMNVFVNKKGEAVYYDAKAPLLKGLPPLPELAKAELGATVSMLDQMASYVTLESPWENVSFPDEIAGLTGVGSTSEADRMTLLDFLEANMEDKDGIHLLNVTMGNIFSLDTSQVSLLHMLFMIRSFGGAFLNITGSGENQAERFRIHGGAQQMALAIAAKLGDALHLSSPVSSITDQGNNVLIEAGNVNVIADRVIVSIPSNIINTISFNPPLPKARVQLQQDLQPGCIWKIWLAYDEPFWRKENYMGQKNGFSGETISIHPDDYILTTLDCSEEGTKPGLLVAFSGGSKGIAFQKLSREERKEEVLRDMVRRFGAEAGRLSQSVKFKSASPQNPEDGSYFEWSWAATEWTEGSCISVPGPRFYTENGQVLRNPYGRIHWAGGDTATQPYGTISGAIQAGERAATEVLLAQPVNVVSV